MKIGTVTFHCSYNFGSALQAWALKRVLENMGHEVQVIDYRGRDFEQYKLMHPANPKALASDVLLWRRNARRRSAFESFMSREMDLTRQYTWHDEDALGDLADQFDCFVCGSDQIWNLDCTHGPVGPYFLSFAGNTPCVAYAPSLAHVSFRLENFTEEDREFIGSRLDRFIAVSVREAGTIELFQPLTKTRIEACLDPTLLLDRDDYDLIRRPVPMKEPFLFCYMLERNPALVAHADNIARRLGLAVAYVSKRPLLFHVPSVNLYGIGPAEFLDAVSRAQSVVTNSFHATVFSVIMGTPFHTVATERSGSRMRELLHELGESGHLVSGPCCENPYPATWAELGPRLDALRSGSRSFLERALKGGVSCV